ncbi:hypothetical protein M8818_002301 [Zalaria obscura]|uniref:Uncharacterized protein n=1 Tax=Zalaria obscura TaxID=2024903 RepID=A0ACC3SKJ2_9PEZI
MSYNQYSGYGGNPYGDNGQAGGYGASNPYGSNEGYGASNPYGGNEYNTAEPQHNHPHPPPATTTLSPPPVTHQTSNYSSNTQGSSYSGANAGAAPTQQNGHGQPITTTMPPQGPTVLSNQDFLARVEAAKADIRTLTSHISQIASAHQRTLSTPDTASSSALESLVTSTQVLNTSIKDQIKFLETDAARSGRNNIKDSQVGQLKTSFRKQLDEYRAEEAGYERRYREQIARQYRIVNPEASEEEVREASQADWGDEGVFQTALKTNRSATASTVLGAVRARHNDIQTIERTLLQLNQLFEDLASAVIIQEPMIAQAEQHTEQVKTDTEAGNVQLDKGITHARRARKMKWWCFFICLAIIAILALVLGLYFGLNSKNK